MDTKDHIKRVPGYTLLTYHYGRVPYGRVPYGRVPYGRVPYGRVPYGRVPYGRVCGYHELDKK